MSNAYIEGYSRCSLCSLHKVSMRGTGDGMSAEGSSACHSCLRSMFCVNVEQYVSTDLFLSDEIRSHHDCQFKEACASIDLLEEFYRKKIHYYFSSNKRIRYYRNRRQHLLIYRKLHANVHCKNITWKVTTILYWVILG